MALELIAVQGMTVIVEPPPPIPPEPPVVAVVVAAAPTITKCRAEGSLIHVDGDEITVTAVTVPAALATIPDPGPFTVALEATTDKVRAEGTAVLREGDISASIDATPQIPGTPPVDYPVTFNCIISVAGQTTVRAEE